MKQSLEEAKKEFIDMLRSTKREGIDNVIEDLQSMGFFEAPASAGHHLNVEGGLVIHSLNTAKAALGIWESMKPLEPSLAGEVSRESIIIASLLHDVCKTDIYKRSVKKRKESARTVGGHRGLQGHLQVISHGPWREVGCTPALLWTGTVRCRDAGHTMAYGRLGSQYAQLRRCA